MLFRSTSAESSARLATLYRQEVIPKCEILEMALELLKTPDDLAAHCDTMRIIHVVAQYLEEVPLPEDAKKPDTLLFENTKFGHFKYKMMITMWEIKVKLSVVIKSLSEGSSTVMVNRLSNFWDIYNGIILAFSTTQ